MKWRGTLSLARPSLRRSAVVGGVAGTAYLAAMATDLWLTGNRYDDLMLWGGLLSRHSVRGRVLGALAHYGLSIGLVATYQAVLPSLPAAPGWLRRIWCSTQASRCFRPPTPWCAPVSCRPSPPGPFLGWRRCVTSPLGWCWAS